MNTYLLLALVCLSIAVCAHNSSPVIGVYTQPALEDWGQETQKYNHIASSQVKYLESAGALVVPIQWDLSEDELKAHFEKINGLFLPGGHIHFVNPDEEIKLYVKNGLYLYNLAKEANDKGDFFPIWGTCLGFEMMLIMEAGNNETVLHEGFNHNNVSDNIVITEYNNSVIFQYLSETALQTLQDGNSSYQYHNDGILPETFFGNPKLVEAYYATAVGTNYEGLQFITAIENKKYPFFGIQFHPEKNPYEQKVNANHSDASVELAHQFARFFVQLARHNTHSYSSFQEALQHSVYRVSEFSLTNTTFMENIMFRKRDSTIELHESIHSLLLGPLV